MLIGMNPYLVTNGNGQEAVKFYESALGARVENLQTFGELPEDPDHPLPEGSQDLLMHAYLKIGDFDLMISDNYPGHPYQIGDELSIALIYDDPDETRQVFEKLSAGGNVGMELQETFWSPLYGIVTDKFGITWQVSTAGKES